MRSTLEQQYDKLFETYKFERPSDAKMIYQILKSSLVDFIKSCRNVAIYCNGGHTKMLMADFAFELKGINYIVDNYADSPDESGFAFIKDEEMEDNKIDGVIISSYKFKDSIAESMEKKHSSIKYLNIYDVFNREGIYLQSDYYYHNHPYQHYQRINLLKNEIKNFIGTDEDNLESMYFALINKYINIKDFRSAINYAREQADIFHEYKYKQLVIDLEKIYKKEQEAAAKIDENSVVMFCFDGLRRQDIEEANMPKLAKIFRDKTFMFDNAYSFSTSTFESLIPVYSGNDDMRTANYTRNYIIEDECSFIQEAKKQERHIYFYTDAEHYIDGEDITYSGVCQTVTEKIWSFILDAVDEKNGFYYIHELYESHYTFSNPYTDGKLVCEGTAMLFDFLPQKGERLRTNYEKQHSDSLRYLDDVVSPIFGAMRCRMLVYADHGNLILDENCRIDEVKKSKLIYDEEWIRIPYIIYSPDMEHGRCKTLISLMSLNDIIMSLLNKKAYNVPQNSYIKIARNELYNPDFRYLYKKMGQDRCLLAFEGFIFDDGYKLIIYSDGYMELLLTETDNIIQNKELTWKYFKIIKNNITVCKTDSINM
ncbi:MAG: hypothetical protein NC433_04960 [Clostridiales bacterium]|nr:hypothetical protein [Clostridiales bacterium]